MPIVLKLSQFLGPDSFFAIDFAQPWARALEAETGGQVKAGTIDIALGLRGAEAERFPRTAILELPFMVRDAASGSRALWQAYLAGMFGAEFQDFKVLALHVHNPGLIHTATKPVRNVADLTGLRFRAPNQAVAATLASVGAIPAILQVNDIEDAVKGGRIDGIVTNWGNPLVGFNDLMHFHTEIAFYTSVFFVVMNKARFERLSADVQAAIDRISNATLVSRFVQFWTKWDKPVRDGAQAPGHEIIVPSSADQATWKAALPPVSRRYLDDLAAGGFADAHAAHAKLRR